MTHTYMTEQEIRAAEQRCQQATKGDWSLEKPQKDEDGWATGVCIGGTMGGRVYANPEGGQRPYNDAVFMAHAHQDLPRALADLRELRRVVRELEKALTTAKDTIRVFNGMGMRKPVEEACWGAYQHSPEMKTINAALDLARQVEGGK